MLTRAPVMTGILVLTVRQVLSMYLHCIYVLTCMRIGIDLCVQDPCVNGNCINYMTDYECDCVTGYEGKNCTSSELRAFKRYVTHPRGVG